MSVNLQKNQKVLLTKEASNLGTTLRKAGVGLGWDCDKINGMDVDLDAWAYVINQDSSKNEMVYFGNKTSKYGDVKHLGDSTTGAGDGDNETITMNLSALLRSVGAIVIGVTIFKGRTKNQYFKHVKNAFIRIYGDNEQEICRYDISKNDTKAVTLVFGILRRVDSTNDWEFISLGQPLDTADKISDITSDRSYTLDGIDKLLEGLSSQLVVGEAKNNSTGGKKNMAVNLSKGGKVSLAKAASDAGVASLTKVGIGLGWDTNRYDGSADFDLDAAAFLTGVSGKVNKDSDFVFYNNTDAPGVHHTGDNRTGEGEGDDELIEVTLDAVAADIDKISFTVTIHDADVRNQNMGMVENAYIRVFDMVTGTEIIRYDLTEDFSVETAIVVGELYRNNGEWKFNAVGSGFSGGLFALCKNFGVNV